MRDTMNLPVGLTDDELDQRRDRLVNLLREAQLVESEKKMANTAFANKLKDLNDEIHTIAAEVRSREEYRDVSIAKRKNFTLGVLEVFRIDTGEIVDSDPLGPKDRQMDLGDELGDRRRQLENAEAE